MPRFQGALEIDRESLLELARGWNLYRSRFAFLRELLENAVDATLLRVFAERGRAAFPTYEGSLSDLRARLAGYPIDVTIERVRGGAEGEEQTYRVVVEDRGRASRAPTSPTSRASGARGRTRAASR